ncbi:MAG: C40 family peptidase [Desulfobulbaceae bacterium]|nr:C40 family peptidase [Desulfobulbaceae bacterium]
MRLKALLNKSIVLTTIALITFISLTDDASARKRRKYDPKKTREEAIQIIRSSSENLCEIAGLDPIVEHSDSLLQNDLMNHAEDLDETTEIGDFGEDIDELETEDDVIVDIDSFKMLWLSYIDDHIQSPYIESGIRKDELMDEIMEWLGTPYRFGGTTTRAIDCSAFTQKIFLSSASILIPRVAREQINIGRKIPRNQLEFGDMVFFHTYSRRFASHVGIYLGDNLFAHASSRFGVTVSSLESSYYKKNFIGGRRITAKDVANLSINKPDVLNAEVNPKD